MLATVEPGVGPPHAQRPVDRGAGRPRRDGRDEGRLLQPALAGQAARRRGPRRCSSASSTSTAGTRQMTNPVVDVVVRRRARAGRRSRAHPPGDPGVSRPRPRPGSTAGRSGDVGGRRPCGGCPSSPTRCEARWRDRAGPGGSRGGLPRHPPARHHGRRGAGPTEAGLRRALPLAAGAHASPASPGGGRPGHPPRGDGPRGHHRPSARRPAGRAGHRRPDPRAAVPGRAALRADSRLNARRWR